MVVAVEFLESSVTHLAREGFRAMNFLESVMSLSSSTVEAMVMKEKDTFHVWSCSSQTTPYICDPVPLADYVVLHLHKDTDSTRNGHCPFLRHYFEKRVYVILIICICTDFNYNTSGFVCCKFTWVFVHTFNHKISTFNIRCKFITKLY